MNNIKDFILAPWPWYVAGPAIGLSVPLLLLLTGKRLGVSSSFHHLCAIPLGKSSIPFFRDHDWKKEAWNLFFVAGLAAGGYLAANFLSNQSYAFLPDGSLAASLASVGLPVKFDFSTAGGAVLLFGGGIFVGFGTRWANGCTSGHAITGLSNLEKSGLVAVIGFFVGGLAAAGVARLLAGL
ncbi:MAG: YeeE/YedE family protein [Spirochaetes bacterium]|nr:YeeE/YedE family protein [Spirochaetota bacterium]